MYFSFKFNFGNDPAVSAPTKVCVANRLISEKMISSAFLILLVLGLFSLFADQFL